MSPSTANPATADTATADTATASSTSANSTTANSTALKTRHPATGNLGSGERVISAILGVAFSLLALQRGGGVSRAVAGVTGAALLARSFAGHCAVKAAMTGESSLGKGVSEQWRRLRARGDDLARTLERTAEELSARVDEAGEESFPASDSPAVHLTDEPPVNAEQKWAASRAAGRLNGNHKA